MVTVYGLNDKVGNLTYYDSSGQSEYNFSKPYSEKTAELIDKEISNLIETQYKRAIDLLETNKEKLTELANVLLDKEVIFRDNLEVIFGKRPFEKSISEIKALESAWSDGTSTELYDACKVNMSEEFKNQNLDVAYKKRQIGYGSSGNLIQSDGVDLRKHRKPQKTPITPTNMPPQITALLRRRGRRYFPVQCLSDGTWDDHVFMSNNL